LQFIFNYKPTFRFLFIQCAACSLVSTFKLQQPTYPLAVTRERHVPPSFLKFQFQYTITFQQRRVMPVNIFAKMTTKRHSS